MANAQYLTLLSGKGGSGKTVIGMSMARVLGEAGYRALLVDCDYSTHGATYFFEDEIATDPELCSFERMNFPLADVDPRIFLTSSGFYFIPYTLRLGEETFVTAKDALSEILKNLARIVEKMK
ncbi:MAG: AAA family ATPase [Acidobacteria bacterium]|nr:AAA family ATPase [Acidobacteriota bacterium]